MHVIPETSKGKNKLVRRNMYAQATVHYANILYLMFPFDEQVISASFED